MDSRNSWMNLTGRSDSFTQSWLLHRKSVLPSMASEVRLNKIFSKVRWSCTPESSGK